MPLSAPHHVVLVLTNHTVLLLDFLLGAVHQIGLVLTNHTVLLVDLLLGAGHHVSLVLSNDALLLFGLQLGADLQVSLVLLNQLLQLSLSLDLLQLHILESKTSLESHFSVLDLAEEVLELQFGEILLHGCFVFLALDDVAQGEVPLHHLDGVASLFNFLISDFHVLLEILLGRQLASSDLSSDVFLEFFELLDSLELLLLPFGLEDLDHFFGFLFLSGGLLAMALFLSGLELPDVLARLLAFSLSFSMHGLNHLFDLLVLLVFAQGMLLHHADNLLVGFLFLHEVVDVLLVLVGLVRLHDLLLRLGLVGLLHEPQVLQVILLKFLLSLLLLQPLQPQSLDLLLGGFVLLLLLETVLLLHGSDVLLGDALLFLLLILELLHGLEDFLILLFDFLLLFKNRPLKFTFVSQGFVLLSLFSSLNALESLIDHSLLLLLPLMAYLVEVFD